MSVVWITRFWLLVIAACVILMLTSCASIQTSDCKRNERGTWVCVKRG